MNIDSDSNSEPPRQEHSESSNHRVSPGRASSDQEPPDGDEDRHGRSGVDNGAFQKEGAATGSATQGTSAKEGGEPPSVVDGYRVSEKVRRLFELVPEIGSARRWYDAPYRLLDWTIRRTRGKQSLHWLRVVLTDGINFLMAFDHYARLKVEPLDDPMENLVLPPGERVMQGGLWVVDFFPPSHYVSLVESLGKNGWDKRSIGLAIDGSSQLRVQAASPR